MKVTFVALGALSGFSAVGLGAFATHALKDSISADMLAIFETAVTYQMWHSLGLIAVALLHQPPLDSKLITWSGWFMFAGIVLFSGSLYVYALTDKTWLAYLTPFGGLFFLLAWLLLCLSAYKKKNTNRYH